MSSSGNLQGFPQNSMPVVDANNEFRWTQPWLQWAIQMWRRTGAAQGGAVSPTGMITAYGAALAPPGWLICDGAAIDRIIYAALFSVIGTNFGIGDGTTTFNIPNLVSKFALGGIAPGTSGGTSSVTLSTGNLPAHNHGITDPQHAHTTLAAASNVTTGTDPGGVTTGGITGSSATGITTTNTGSGTSFSILPPYVEVGFIIKT